MTTSRSRTPDTETAGDPSVDSPGNETPELNVYELHADRTVLTESGNTDGWIATDLTVTLSE
jgi:hypothetical protein